MKKLFLIAAATLLFAANALAQAATIEKTDLSPAEINRIVKAFTANESRFRAALNTYVYSRSATINTIGMGGQITGTYRRDSFMGFNADGSRAERIDFAPVPTLTEITITPADIDNLGGLDQFAIEPKYADLYTFSFVGKEKIDELNLYVFDVAPKVMPEAKKNGQLLFQGRIWVDDKDLLIVRSKGKAVPEWKNERYPVMESWRENVDGKYWFPSYSAADDELVFNNGNVVRVKVRVKYTSYALGRTHVKAVGEDEDVPAQKPAPPAAEKKP
jgi:hypothetical protein